MRKSEGKVASAGGNCLTDKLIRTFDAPPLGALSHVAYTLVTMIVVSSTQGLSISTVSQKDTCFLSSPPIASLSTRSAGLLSMFLAATPIHRGAISARG